MKFRRDSTWAQYSNGLQITTSRIRPDPLTREFKFVDVNPCVN